MHCTVLIPAYNTVKYIGETIESVLKQTYKDFDILVVDDGSTDGTGIEVTKYMKGNDISLVRLPDNQGLARAMERGIEEAQGPVITFVGSDDTITGHSLMCAMPYFEEDPDLGYLWTNFRFKNGRRGWSRSLPSGCTLWEAMVERGWWRACAQQFFSKPWYEKSSKLDTSIPYAVDYQLAILLGETGCNTKFVNQVTYSSMRPRAGSISTEKRRQQKKCDRLIRHKAKKRSRRNEV